MATAPSVHDVHVINLMYLLAVQKCVNEDSVRACTLYGLSADEADQIKGLSLEAVHTLAGSLNECIATLRMNPSVLLSMSGKHPVVQTLLGTLYDHAPSRVRTTASVAA
ncbi:MAG TPA: flagellar transcriptional regulator FlhD [Burkholderiaceae bacterium]|nr:flagellar transcriptional regulator FlhD [Burkholderiaceae bacterium]